MIENDTQEETKEETKQDLKSSIVNQLMATEHGFTVKIAVMKALPSFFETLKLTPNNEKVLQDIVGVQ